MIQYAYNNDKKVSFMVIKPLTVVRNEYIKVLRGDSD